jgi:hypothetical protein
MRQIIQALRSLWAWRIGFDQKPRVRGSEAVSSFERGRPVSNSIAEDVKLRGEFAVCSEPFFTAWPRTNDWDR